MNKKTDTSLYFEFAKKQMLYEFLKGKIDYQDESFSEQTLSDLLQFNDEDSYQIVIYENYRPNSQNDNFDFFELLSMTPSGKEHCDFITVDEQNVILLREKSVIEHLSSILDKYSSNLPPQKNSPLDQCFLACGRVVNNAKDIPVSYSDALALVQRRFFCERHQHYLHYEIEQNNNSINPQFVQDKNFLSDYTDNFVILIQTYNRHRIKNLLGELEDKLFFMPISIADQKNLLLDLYLGIKEKIDNYYKAYEIPFVSNSSAIRYILGSNYLYQIIDFLSKQFEMIMNSTGHFSRDSIIDVIINYVEHNYAENITLDNISPIFGYNSSYLGKIFTQKTGTNFHAYLDDVRIEKAKELLVDTKLPVYRIATQVGYNNVDYFHIKFKKKTGISPAAYRNQAE